MEISRNPPSGLWKFKSEHSKNRAVLSENASFSGSAVSSSLPTHGLQPSRLLCPWDSPGGNTAVGSHSLLQGIFLTQVLNSGLLLCRLIHYHLNHQGSPLLVVYSVSMSDSCNLMDLWSSRLLCPQDFPSTVIGVDYHFLLQGTFLTQGSNLSLLHGRDTKEALPGKPHYYVMGLQIT